MLEEVDYTCRSHQITNHELAYNITCRLYMYNVIHFPLLWSFNFKSRPHVITMAE